MKKQYTLIALCLALCAGSAFAADTGSKAADSGAAPKATRTKQQSKMGNCSKEAKAKTLKGAERKQFMSTCLKAKA